MVEKLESVKVALMVEMTASATVDTMVGRADGCLDG